MLKLYTFITSVFLLVSSLAFSQMEYKPGEILIQFTAEASPKEVIAKYAYNRNLPTSVSLGDLLSEPMNIYRLNFNPEMIDEKALLQKLKTDREVSNVQFNHYVYPRSTVPNDPNIGSQWHHINDGSNGLADADIDSDLAWDITTGGLTALGDTIVVCVIEGGNLLHPDLIGNAWFNYNEIPGNGIDDDGNGYIDDYRGWNVASETDDGVYSGSHGTSVMGMIGAKGNNEYGTVGANWAVKIMSVAGENIYDEASVVQAYTYPLIQRKLYNSTGGANGAFVVATNASWGIDGGDVAEVPIWSAFYDTLGHHGILNCGSTSNNNVNIDVVGDIPTAVESDYMISVTATNSSDYRTFSGYGATTVDLGAPGENVVTTAGQSGTTTTSGTSFASPLTAGVIGLLYSAPCAEFAQVVLDNPQLGADYIRYVLLGGVDQIENLALETVTGGRLNAYNSLTMILNNCADNFCIPPFSFTSTVENDTIFNFSWIMTEDQTASIRFRLLGSEQWTYTEMLDTTYFSLDTLTICADYEFEIATSCNGDMENLNYESSIVLQTPGCCIAPVNAEANQFSETTINLAWTPGFNINGYEIFYRTVDSTEWILSGTSMDGNYLINNLDTCTNYEILIRPDCITGFDVGAFLYERTAGCGNCIDLEYCSSISDDSSDEFIESVQIGDFFNESGNNDGYAIFEETGLELGLGYAYETTLTPGFGFFPYSERFKLWVDLNQDGEFSDDEILLQSQTASNLALTGTITIPQNALEGATRMRVTVKYGGGGSSAPVACGSYGYGETEDYCVTIVNTTGIEDDMQLSVFEIFPNPANKSFNLNFEPLPGNSFAAYEVKIIDLAGKTVYISEVNPGVNRLSPALMNGAYTIQLYSENGKLIKTDKLVVIQ